MSQWWYVTINLLVKDLEKLGFTRLPEGQHKSIRFDDGVIPEGYTSNPVTFVNQWNGFEVRTETTTFEETDEIFIAQLLGSRVKNLMVRFSKYGTMTQYTGVIGMEPVICGDAYSASGWFLDRLKELL